MEAQAMPMPEWATDELRGALFDKMEGAEPVSGFKVRELEPITCFSTLFSEYQVRGGGLIIHFFPRAGADDQWHHGYYLPKCRKCGAERPNVTASKVKPCERCGHVGLVFVPGRVEAKPTGRGFPLQIAELVKHAVDSVWVGAVAIEDVDELGAVVAQVQGWDKPASDKSTFDLVMKLCDELDKSIDSATTN